MKTYRARGIVLHTVRYGDFGLVVYMYTDLFGRQTYLVQGVRSARSKGNKAALYQPMFVLEYEGIEPRHGEMHKMKDVSAAIALSSIPFDVRKSTVALFMAEVLYRMIREQEPNARLFSFLSDAVHTLDIMDEGTANFHLWFLVKLSYFLGFYPGNQWSEHSYFDIARGEFIPMIPSHRMYMERGQSRLLGRLMDIRLDEIGRIGLNRDQRVAFLNDLIAFISYHSDSIHAVRSIEILREVF